MNLNGWRMTEVAAGRSIDMVRIPGRRSGNVASQGRKPRFGVGVVTLLSLLLVLTSCGATPSGSNNTAGNGASLGIATWQSSKPFDNSVGAPLPTNRIVAVYGISGGVQFNGAASTLDMLDNYLPQLQALGRQYAAADPTHPVKLGIDLVVNVIQPCTWYPKYCTSWAPDATKYINGTKVDGIQDYINYCQKHDLYLFLDLQLGVEPVSHALIYTDNKDNPVPIIDYLQKYPFVELALDTEFHFPNTPEGYGMAAGYPCCLGWMDAAEVNWTIDKLAQISLQYHLPRKVLVLHQWNSAVLTNKDKIRSNPDTSLVLQSDGFGALADKLADYSIFVQQHMIQYGGYKLFFQYPGTNAGDNPLQTPAQVLQVFPQPLFVSYE